MADLLPVVSNSGLLDDPMLLSQWFAVAWSREVPPGGLVALRVMARDVLLWRSGAGELHFWLDLCVHRGAKLSLGALRNGCIVCPYHGWRYDAAGKCVSIPAHPDQVPPAKARAAVFAVQERYGVIWSYFGDREEAPVKPLPEFPIAEEAGFRALLAGPYRFRALGPRLIENLLDVAHLGIVHEGLLGDADHARIEEYEVLPGTKVAGPEAKAIRIWQPNPDGTGQGAAVMYDYRVQGPLTAGFVKLPAAEGDKRFGILAQVVPVDGEFSEMRMIMALNYGDEIPDAELIAFQDFVAGQDKAIVESQRPELLPLDLQTELHLRSDRIAIAYRKWLKEIGFRYGVA